MLNRINKWLAIHEKAETFSNMTSLMLAYRKAGEKQSRTKQNKTKTVQLTEPSMCISGFSAALNYFTYNYISLRILIFIIHINFIILIIQIKYR